MQLSLAPQPIIAARPIAQADAQTGGAFATPSVAHFGVVLLLSAIRSTPWEGITSMAVLGGVVDLGEDWMTSLSDRGRRGSMRIGVLGSGLMSGTS
jgi:hypothetical protein